MVGVGDRHAHPPRQLGRLRVLPRQQTDRHQDPHQRHHLFARRLAEPDGLSGKERPGVRHQPDAPKRLYRSLLRTAGPRVLRVQRRGAPAGKRIAHEAPKDPHGPDRLPDGQVQPLHQRRWFAGGGRPDHRQTDRERQDRGDCRHRVSSNHGNSSSNSGSSASDSIRFDPIRFTAETMGETGPVLRSASILCTHDCLRPLSHTLLCLVVFVSLWLFLVLHNTTQHTAGNSGP
mmetsp:Transcript_11563/g.24527  ORF Transcript_11563/g.24527 Transcript_11563/m.24527 type:complete len:232 (+) Transcript_11563:456-1151(+)